MADAGSVEATERKPLRLWPGVAIVALQWLCRFGLPVVAPGAMVFALLGGLAGGLLVVVWWLFFSRAAWVERLGAVGLMLVALYATPSILHESIRTGNMGMQYLLYAIPVLSLAFVVWAVVTRRIPDGMRRVTMVATILVACLAWALLRTDGVIGDGRAEFAWRWSATAEERLMARDGEKQVEVPSAPVFAAAEVEWPGFRGPGRDGIVRVLHIETDWATSPPVELWRRPVGPGASSFAAGGGLLYTQEQRGDDEIVSCYRVDTGEPVWMYADVARFWDAHVGAGPRATPTLHGGRVYALGATGILNALDAVDGSLVWSRDAAEDTGATEQSFGFTGSPLVVGDVVVAAVGGELVAYDLASGEPRWFGPEGGTGFSSPHLLTIGGIEQLLLLSEAGTTSVSPVNGRQLWRREAPGLAILQPALTRDGDLLVADVEMVNVELVRVAVSQGPDGWTLEERWRSNRFKPYFNDYVVHGGHAYGFDGSILACADLENGERSWKGGRYGHGQLLLLADQGLLLVIAEQGRLALVAAVPDGFTELARFEGIEGRTWNHPALAGDVLLVRNGEEMAAFRLPAS